MQAFTTHAGLTVPLDRANVDTDQIIPKQFLKSIRRTGFGDNLFDAWRFVDEGTMSKTPNERELNHEFVLNDPQYQGASILIARDNFGCGSSREHAVWALQEYGFRAVIAPSFADIFFTNSMKNGLLLIVLEEEKVRKLIDESARQPLSLDIDLRAETVVLPDGEQWTFHVDPQRKDALLGGLDDIGLTLAHSDAIQAFEAKHRRSQPWVFRS